jgi:O-phosphoseryl-tRNA(Sec) kinase
MASSSSLDPPVLLLLVGLPASGKSSIAQHICESIVFQKFFSKITVIDTDVIRLRFFGTDFKPQNEVKVVAQKKIAAIQALEQAHKHKNDQKQRSLVIIDDMHYYISMRHVYYELSQKVQALFISVYIDSPVNTCIKWNEQRGSPIPTSVIEDVAQKWDAPGKKYRWDQPHVIVSPHVDSFDTILKQIYQQIEAELAQFKKSAVPGQSQINSAENQTLSNGADRKGQQTSEYLDKASKNLFGIILQGKDQFPHQSQIVDLLSTNLNLKQTDSHFATRFSALRKPFLAWLLKYSKTEASFDNLILFLRKPL